jgi:hypothetical protein
MKYPALPLLLALLLGSVCSAVRAAEPTTGFSAEAHNSAAALVSQPDADAALSWLRENYPPGSDLRYDLDFLAAATDTFIDPENASVRLFVYTSNILTAGGRPLWTAWVGVENNELVVVLVDSAPHE